MMYLTGPRGEAIARPEYYREPEPGSVVLTHGEHGTAWQRFFADGMWHSVRGGAPRKWTQLLAHRNLVLVYSAEPREDEGR